MGLNCSSIVANMAAETVIEVPMHLVNLACAVLSKLCKLAPASGEEGIAVSVAASGLRVAIIFVRIVWIKPLPNVTGVDVFVIFVPLDVHNLGQVGIMIKPFELFIRLLLDLCRRLCGEVEKQALRTTNPRQNEVVDGQVLLPVSKSP